MTEEMSNRSLLGSALDEGEDMLSPALDDRLAPQVVFDSDRFGTQQRTPWRWESPAAWATDPTTSEGTRFSDALRSAANVVDSRPAACVEPEAIALRSVAHLAAAAAHEINNPLTIIFGGLELLAQNAELDEQSQRWVSRVLDAARDIHRTVRQMGHIKRLETVSGMTGLPVMLDIERSSEEPTEPASRTDLAGRLRTAYRTA
jgi:signal transduction histidine kinase